MTDTADERQQDRKARGESVAHNAPFPSVIVVFRPHYAGPLVATAIDRSGLPFIAEEAAS